MNFIDVIAYLVFIGLGLIFGYMIGYGRNLSDIQAEYEKARIGLSKIIDRWEREYVKLYEKYRDLQDSMCIEEIEDIK